MCPRRAQGSRRSRPAGPDGSMDRQAQGETPMGQEFRTEERRAVSPLVEAARAERVVGTHPSEDVSHLLPPLTVSPEPAERDYGPRPWIEWVVDLAGDATVTRTQLLSIFTEPVLEEL